MSRHLGRPLALFAVVMAVASLSACGIPTSAAPTAIAKANVPFHLLDPVTPTTLAPTDPTAAVPETIYLVAPDQTVIAVSRDVPVPANLTDVVAALLDGPTTAESRLFGLQSFLTGTTTTVTATVAGGIATVDFSSNPVPSQVVGPDQTLAIAQVVYTVTQYDPAVAGVVFHIAGQPIGVPTATGAQVTGPVTRASYPQTPLA